MGKFAEAVAEAAVSLSTDSVFTAIHLNLKFAANLAGLAAAPVTKCTSLTLEFSNNLENIFEHGSVDLQDISANDFSVNITAEFIFRDSTEYDLFKAGTKQSMRADIINTGKTIGASTNPSLQIDFAQIPREEWKMVGENPDVLRQTWTARAEFSQTDSSMVTAKLVNTETDYEA
jgi:hypothetical protein